MRNYILLTALVVCIFSSFVFAIGGDMGGSTQNGSADYPYLIEDFDDFEIFRSDPNYWASGVNTRLDCDLDLDPNLAGRMIYSQAPIAPDINSSNFGYQGIMFTGFFNGNDHIVNNLKIEGDGYLGLFGKTDLNSEIKNIGLENVSIRGSGNYIGSGDYIGGLVSRNNYCNITNCYSSGSITGLGAVGGLVGKNDNSSINNCYSTSLVSGSNNVGGIIGDSVRGNISNCYSTNSVNGSASVGGIVGKSCESNIIDCYSKDGVTGICYVGGLIGWNYDGTIINCYSEASIRCSNDYVGGLVGKNEDGNITNSYATGEVTGTESYYIGGLVGDNNYGTITNSNAIGAVNGYKSVGGLIGDNNTGNIINSYAIGEVTGECEVASLIGHNRFGSIVNCYATGNVTGMHNIASLVGYNNFGGITRSYSTGVVNGLGVNIGGLVGTNSGDISTCYSTSIVIGSSNESYYVGGLIGYNDDSDISNSYSIGAVNGYRYVGGLIGCDSGGNITNCYATGAVTGSDSNYTGGLVGVNYSYITNSFWDVETSGMVEGIGNEEPYPNCVTGKTTLEMQTLSTFTAAVWDFVGEDNNGDENIWRMCVNGVSYPKLWWEFGVGDFACGDGVDIVDFAVLAESWGESVGQVGYNDRCDLSGDDVIGFADLAVFCDNWLWGIE